MEPERASFQLQSKLTLLVSTWPGVPNSQGRLTTGAGDGLPSAEQQRLQPLTQEAGVAQQRGALEDELHSCSVPF